MNIQFWILIFLGTFAFVPAARTDEVKSEFAKSIKVVANEENGEMRFTITNTSKKHLHVFEDQLPWGNR